MIECVKCKSLCTIPICYGKPSPELERAAARGLVELGSCVIQENDPNRRCLDCNLAWLVISAVASAISEFESRVDTIRIIIEKFRSPLDYAILEYGSACYEYGVKGQLDMEAHREMLTAYENILHWWDYFLGSVNRLRDYDAAVVDVFLNNEEENKSFIIELARDYGASCINSGAALKRNRAKRSLLSRLDSFWGDIYQSLKSKVLDSYNYGP